MGIISNEAVALLQYFALRAEDRYRWVSATVEADEGVGTFEVAGVCRDTGGGHYSGSVKIEKSYATGNPQDCCL